MTVVAVRCAARWAPDTGFDLDGSDVEVDLNHPGLVRIDDAALIVLHGRWWPAKQVASSYDGEVYTREAEITARMPMENGAILDITWPDRELVGVSVGIDRPEGCVPLVETAGDLRPAHGDCAGDGCTDLCCGSSLLDEGTGLDSISLLGLLAVWRRVGAKPVVPYPTQLPRRRTRRRLNPVEQRVRGGQTVTLEEWRRWEL